MACSNSVSPRTSRTFARAANPTSDILRPTLAHALTNADRYVWVYPENVIFPKPEKDGGAEEAWVTALRRRREDYDRAPRLRK